MIRTTLEALREENPPHAAYMAGMVDAVRANGQGGYERAEVAAQAVRGIVTVGGAEWAVLVEEIGEPTARDWRLAQNAYGSSKVLRVEGDATEATCQGCEACVFGAIFPCPSQTGVWYAAHPLPAFR